MRKLYLLLVFFILKSSVIAQVQQKEYWKVYFPEYLASAYKANVDIDGNLNMALNKDMSNSSGRFISLNKNGYLIYSEEVLAIALLHFKDSAGNRYQVSYTSPAVTVKKTDTQNNTLWSTNYTIPNPVVMTGLGESTFLNSIQYLFTSNGKLIISGHLAGSNYGDEKITLLFIDAASGNELARFNKFPVSVKPYTELQEDANGNINLFSYAEASSSLVIDKVDQSGNLIIQQEYGYDNNYQDNVLFKRTSNYFYVGVSDVIEEITTLIKLDKTTLDTIFLVDSIDFFEYYDRFNATDSMCYMTNAFSSARIRSYDFYGNLTCGLNQTSTVGSGLIIDEGKCYFLGYGLNVQLKDNCEFDTLATFLNDINLSDLLSNLMGTGNGYSNDSYVGKETVYLVGRNYPEFLGIAGFLDKKANDFSGNLYFDTNNDCSYDSTETGLPNQMVKIDPGGNYLFTDLQGRFENYLPLGNYSLEGYAFNSTLNLCPSSIPLAIVDTSIINSANNIGVQDQIGNLQDLAITINQTNAIPGYKSHIYLNVRNFEPLPANGIIKLTIDTSLFTYFSASPGPDSVSLGNIYWHVNNLGILNANSIYASFNVRASALLNSNFTSKAEITNTGGEIFLTNNIDYYQGSIIGSFDPNNKSVYPVGIGLNGVISPNDSVLNYKIQFQNTGSYKAFNIKVVDTIDASLDISSFRFLSSKHNCEVSFVAPNILVFIFNDINLPDYVTNEALSHGFINYSIHLKQNLPLLTQIKNKAAIYFDFNEPVITNETVNTIDIVGIKELDKKDLIKIYPNPAEDFIKVIVPRDLQSINISIIDLQGRIIQSEKLNVESGKTDLSLSRIQTGFYLLNVVSGNYNFTQSFVKR